MHSKILQQFTAIILFIEYYNWNTGAPISWFWNFLYFIKRLVKNQLGIFFKLCFTKSNLRKTILKKYDLQNLNLVYELAF